MPTLTRSKGESPSWTLEDERQWLAWKLKQEDLEKRSPRKRTATPGPPPSLRDFAERTLSFRLDPWQRRLCEILEHVVETPGARVAIHAPPQHGKSVLVSQRFPAWVLGRDPLCRIRLACYNISHATGFGSVVRDLMQDPVYRAAFPSPECQVPPGVARGAWSTQARAATRDGQESFLALGLQTGFVGKGADLLIIDDPYASPQDALSETIRASVALFWEAAAKVRLEDHSRVVLMFHRYHELDLAGQLLAEGGWECYRFAALADAPDDPVGRAIGEKLTPRRSDEFYTQQQANMSIWLSQFQGIPSRAEGNLFHPDQIRLMDAAPAGLREVRAWDLSAGVKDFTAGVKIGVDGDGRYWILDVVRERLDVDRRDALIRQTAAADGTACAIRLPQDPASAGVREATMLVRMLAGYDVKAQRMTGPKETRAAPFASQVNAGNVFALNRHWWPALREELRGFPLGAHDDQVDAAGDAFGALALAPPAELMAW